MTTTTSTPTDIVFYFEVHQPFRLVQRGPTKGQWDEGLDRLVLERIADNCYLPMNRLLLDAIEATDGKFRCSFALSGTVIEQLERWSPETLQSFVDLADSGAAEFVCETTHHSLAGLSDTDEFEAQVLAQRDRITALFGQKPTTFRNTELIIDESIARRVEALGFHTMLAEGTELLLDWRQPFWCYRAKGCEHLRLMLRCYPFSDDIGFRFSNQEWSEYPLTADRYVEWLEGLPENADFVGLYMDYETFGEHQPADSGIFEFMREIPDLVLETESLRFATPAEAAARSKIVADLDIERAVSWADEERDTSAWLGNPMQHHAELELYELRPDVLRASEHGHADLLEEWRKLTTSDHPYYMCTKRASDQDVHEYFSPFDSPHDAFVVFMKALDDLRDRVGQALAAVDGDAPSTDSDCKESRRTPR